MNTTLHEQINGNFTIFNDDEDAPLLELKFMNEGKDLTPAYKALVARATHKALITQLHNAKDEEHRLD